MPGAYLFAFVEGGAGPVRVRTGASQGRGIFLSTEKNIPDHRVEGAKYPWVTH